MTKTMNEIQIGKYLIVIPDLPKGIVYVERNGEGGSFDIKHFEEALDNMFDERF